MPLPARKQETARILKPYVIKCTLLTSWKTKIMRFGAPHDKISKRCKINNGKHGEQKVHSIAILNLWRLGEINA